MSAGRRGRRLVPMTTSELHTQLLALRAERAAAGLAGLDRHPRYLADLARETDIARHAFVGAAVTEIASFRASLGAPLLG
jgi:hypothetical protein